MAEAKEAKAEVKAEVKAPVAPKKDVKKLHRIRTLEAINKMANKRKAKNLKDRLLNN